MQINVEGIQYNYHTHGRAKVGALPDFVIIGAQKAGTTALRFNLNKHPGLYLASDPDRENSSEVHFFNTDKGWDRGIDWYKSLFPRKKLIQGEKTPNYINSPIAHERMHQVIPDAKLILMLRNPVNRAYSQWNHFNQVEAPLDRGWRITSFESALAEAWRGQHKIFKSLVDQGLYIQMIEHLLQYFPREQLFIGIAERFKSDPQNELNRVFDFLGVERKQIEHKKVHERQYETSMEPATRTLLESLFAPYNDALFDFLGFDIPEWQTD